jgi:NhaP-type Na+/H+ or K+/H+ antiporter
MEKLFGTIILAAFFGVVFKILAYRLKIPAIVPLLIGGISLGPYGVNIVQPEYLGNGLPLIISVCIGIILFEGGLTLDTQGFTMSRKIIGKLLSLGVIITWIGTALIAWLLLDYSITFSLLIGSLIIVTGPSVISPILRRISVRQKVKQILNWEAIFIDPIGVFIAILCFDWLTTTGTIQSHLIGFSLRFFTGAVSGFVAGLLLYWLIKRKIIPPAYIILFTLVFVLLVYFLSNYFSHESGLLSVVVAGFTFAYFKPHGIKNVLHFKFELSELALAVLFVLLAANLKLENFLQLTTYQLLFILCAVFLIRPISILLCSANSDLKKREKIFLSWVAPRGIVAASIASLFSLELKKLGYENAWFVETFVYAVIIITVILQGSTAELFAKLLKLAKDKSPVVLFVGANRFSRNLAQAIENNSDISCYLIDTNHKFVNVAIEKGLKASHNDAFVPEEIPQIITSSLKSVIVLTDNEELNRSICEVWSNYVKKEQLYSWGSKLMREKFGKPVWSFIPKPSDVSAELKDSKNEFIVSENANGVVHIHYKEHLLLTIKGNKSEIEIR